MAFVAHDEIWTGLLEEVVELLDHLGVAVFRLGCVDQSAEEPIGNEEHTAVVEPLLELAKTCTKGIRGRRANLDYFNLLVTSLRPALQF